MTNGPKITAIVTCFNSESVLRPCLESLKWVDELIVVDSFSTDSTLQIAKEFTDKVFQRKYTSPPDQKNWAIPQASHEWVLILDSDERVSPELRAEVEERVNDPKGCAGFWIKRLNHTFGKPMKYDPDWQMRLFLRDKGRYDDRIVHEQAYVDGIDGRLVNPILHFGQREIDQIIKVTVRYSIWEAEQRNLEGVKFRPWHLFTMPIRAFVVRYFLRRQFVNGKEGLFMCGFAAWYYFLTFARLWQIQKNPELSGK